MATLVEAGRLDQAEAYARSYAAADHHAGRYLRLTLVRMLQQRGRIDSALKLVDDVIAQAGDAWTDDESRVELLESKIDLLISAERFEQAGEFIEAHLADPLCLDRPALRAKVVELLVARDGLDSAVEYVLRSGAGPKDVRTRAVILSHLVVSERPDLMAPLALAWIKNDPLDDTLVRDTVLELWLRQEWASAANVLAVWEQKLSAAMADTPPAARVRSRVDLWRQVRTDLLTTLLQQQAYARVIELGEGFLADDPEAVEIMRYVSTAMDEAGRPADALALMERARDVATRPDFVAAEADVFSIDDGARLRPPGMSPGVGDMRHTSLDRLELRSGVFNDLSYTYAERGVRLAEAESLISRALEIDERLRAYRNDHSGETHAYMLDTLGWVQYKQGRAQDAAVTFEEVIAASRRQVVRGMADESAVVYDHAGDVLYRIWRHEEAVVMWRQALQLARAAEDSRDIRQVRRVARLKLAALADGRVPPVAPLGEGVTDELMRLGETRRQAKQAGDPPADAPGS